MPNQTVRLEKAAASLALVLLCLLSSSASAQNRRQPNDGEHWVSTWATALQLAPGTFGGRGGGRGTAQSPPAPAANASSVPTAPREERPQPQRRVAPRPANLPATFSDQTIRMIVRTSLGGRRVRVSLSNMVTAQPLEVGAAHIALHKAAGAIVPKTDRTLTFGGSPFVVLPPGVLTVSDPVELDVAPASDLAIPLYLPRDTGPPTTHTVGLHTGYIAAGNTTADEAMPSAETTAVRTSGCRASTSWLRLTHSP